MIEQDVVAARDEHLAGEVVAFRHRLDNGCGALVL